MRVFPTLLRKRRERRIFQTKMLFVGKFTFLEVLVFIGKICLSRRFYNSVGKEVFPTKAKISGRKEIKTSSPSFFPRPKSPSTRLSLPRFSSFAAASSHRLSPSLPTKFRVRFVYTSLNPAVHSFPKLGLYYLKRKISGRNVISCSTRGSQSFLVNITVSYPINVTKRSLTFFLP